MRKSTIKSKRLVGLVVEHAFALLSFCLVAALLFSSLSNVVSAAGGDLDPTFGSGGKVTTDLTGGFEVANAIGIQPDGKIVVAGSRYSASDPNGVASDFLIARYDSNGSLDPTFRGTNGSVLPNVGGVLTDFGGRDSARGIVIQLDGKIVAAGYSSGSFALARYNQDGSLDTSFGNGGMTLTSSFGEASGLVLQSDGKLVVAGSSFNNAIGNYDFAIARYNSDGSLDTTFDGDGKVIIDFGYHDNAHAVALEPDNRIIVAGSAQIPGTVHHRFALARFLPDGSPDPLFGTGGKSTTNVSTDGIALALALQEPGDKIIAAGSYADSIGNKGMATVRFNKDGSVDPTFGFTVTGTPRNGMLLYPNRGEVRALALEADGIIAAGIGPFNTGTQFFLNRHDKDGRPDLFFNGTTDFGGFAEANALGIQLDGQLVAAGSASFAGTLADFALARYQASSPPASCTVTCPSDITAFNDPGQAGAIVSYTPPIVSGACGVVTCTHDPGSFFPVGTTTVTCSESAGTASDSFNVTVTDNEAPSITSCAADRTVTVGESAGAILPDLRAELVATDNYSAASTLTVTQSPTAGTPLTALGQTLVTFTVTDQANNSSTCVARVTVVDDQAPMITSCPIDRVLTADESCGASLPDLTGELIATDNFTLSPGLTVTQFPAVGTRLGLEGDTLVTLTVTDEANNSSTCVARLSVADRTPPRITLFNPLTTFIVPTTSCQVGIPSPAPIPDFISAMEATDCGQFTISQSPAAGTLVNVGTTTAVSIVLTDDVGNTTTRIVNVEAVGDADCDGIGNPIDQNHVTGADNSQVFSSDFHRAQFSGPLAQGPSFGTILDRAGWNVLINPLSQFGVMAGVDGPGMPAEAIVQACNKPYEIRFGTSGQKAWVACDVAPFVNGNPGNPFIGLRMMVAAIATPAGSSILVRRPATDIAPGWDVFLTAASRAAYLGSPITADPENESPMAIRFFDHSHLVIGSMALPPGQTVDLQQAAGGLSITNLGTVPLTFTLDGVTRTLSLGETFVQNQPPVARARNITVSANGNCSATITPAQVDDGSSDPDSGDVITLSLDNAGPFSPGGPYQVTLIATDTHNATSFAQASVMVVDTTPPAVTAPISMTAYSDINCQAAIPNVLTQVTASDSCGPVTLSQSPAAGTLAGAGTHTITVTATDGSNNSHSVMTTFTVIAVPSFNVSVNPTNVRRGGRVTLDASFRNCASSRQTVTLKVSLTSPATNTLMMTSPVTLQAGQAGSVSIPLTIPRSTPTGLYSLRLEVHLDGTNVGTSTAQLTVVP